MSALRREASAISPDPVLVYRLRWMQVRQGHDPRVMLDRQVLLGQMSRKHADRVFALFEKSFGEEGFTRPCGGADWAALADDMALHRR